MHAVSSSEPPELLEARPEARAFKIEDLMQQIRAGRLRIPSFQRRLAWDRNDARKLVDSLYRGYPVGTLLFWESEAQAERLQWGEWRLEAPYLPNALLVVDGQQRLVSLARILLTSDEDGDDFTLLFDLDKCSFHAPSPTLHVEADPGRWLPLNRILDSERLFAWLFDHAGSRERREQALLLGKRLREYDIPAYVVRSGSEATLREIFGRLNSSGKRLSDAEVFDALNGARAGQSKASLKALVTTLAASTEFGCIDEDLLYRLVRVVQGMDVIVGGTAEPLRLAPQTAPDVFARTEALADRVIRFVRLDAGIAHHDLLPYRLPLVTLGKFFLHHPQPRPRSRELLARWLWRGALDGSHTGNTVATRSALDRIDPHDEEGSVQRLLGMVARQPVPGPSTGERFNFRHATAKLMSLALLDLEPRDLRTGEPIDIGYWLDRRGDETTGAAADPPFAQILRSAAAAPDALRSVANRLVHPGSAGLKALLIRTTDADVLASHAITAQAHAALLAGDDAGFLRARAERLALHLPPFFARHARWEASDRPSLASLCVPEDDDEEAP
ncbi:DUF262 domain-containing protein [Sphaerotilus uruguayifluvii]|uniref:GmrSD restriction endonucleases N-terminal domain-containing protein n=1 Tax=Sphaerotilus uruguayifluvii TaxID=2735897 RepID=A0ABX2G0E2_9BURK|nr:DUF262 domain-containing protein [Leptothrix sp. C29]NRT54890.1 hypothetical protein [Leptothrix sp. C29]